MDLFSDQKIQRIVNIYEGKFFRIRFLIISFLNYFSAQIELTVGNNEVKTLFQILILTYLTYVIFSMSYESFDIKRLLMSNDTYDLKI